MRFNGLREAYQASRTGNRGGLEHAQGNEHQREVAAPGKRFLKLAVPAPARRDRCKRIQVQFAGHDPACLFLPASKTKHTGLPFVRLKCLHFPASFRPGRINLGRTRMVPAND